MDNASLTTLFLILLFLLFLSALFSSSETGMMALNKYRLRHRVKEGDKAAKRVEKLLEKPDRLLGVILLGNNFVNIFASSIATIIAMHIWGEAGIALAAGILTLVVLIFSEVAPKTLAALYPEKIAYPAAFFLTPLLKLFSPIVWGVNFVANGFLRLFGVKVGQHQADEALSHEELQTLIDEATGQLPKQYREMLKSILNLETVTVEDVMIPKQDIFAIDVDQSMKEIMKTLSRSHYTRIPLYRGSLDDELIGILNMRKIVPLLLKGENEIRLKDIIKLARPPYFIPEVTTLSMQLGNFKKYRRRMALIVDEYGDLQGLVTMEDLLEEIVGKLSTEVQSNPEENVTLNEDGSMLIDAGEFIRDLNKNYQLNLPTNGPKTLNGLIQEELETLPNEGTCIKVGNDVLEVVKSNPNAIETVKLIPLPQNKDASND